MVQVVVVGDRSTTVFAVTCAMLALATCFVILRLISKLGLVRKPTWDDAMIVLAWVRTTGGRSPCFASLIMCALCFGTAPCCWIVNIHHVRIDGRPGQTGCG